VDARYVTDHKVAQAFPQWQMSSIKGWQNTHSIDQEVTRNLESFFQTKEVETEID
jgi:hypothetical protein